MQKVLESRSSTESRGSIVNGKIRSMDIWQVWVLTLDCGHKVKRKNTGFPPPAKVKCNVCVKTGLDG